MLRATIVETEEELLQIRQLNLQNLKSNIDEEAKNKEGFVTWLYSIELLKNMHKFAPSIIVKDKEKLAAHALTTLKESKAFHNDLDAMFRNLEMVRYKGSPLSSCKFYCMGQICVDKNIAGKDL